ncbi:MAG: hypothetical protein JNG83_14505 [Opitutaceae bacterium]|nr:hypothetical protein [Opitutaceae bacterium]
MPTSPSPAPFLRRLLPLAALAAAAAVPAAEPEFIADRLELFADRHLVEQARNVQFAVGTPRAENIVFQFDEPWEGPMSGCYVTVLKDGDLYRMWYRGARKGADGLYDRHSDLTCYAESRDGITWVKPRLGLHEFKGSRENNIVWPSGEPRIAHNFSVMLDDRPGVPADQRYKAVGGTKSHGLVRLASADGLRWRILPLAPLFKDYALDTMNVLTWSPAEQVYAIYLRTWTHGGTPQHPAFVGARTISRSVSQDFVTWSEPEPMTFGDTPTEDLYTNATHPYFRAPHILIALPLRFVNNRQALTAAELEAWNVNPNQRTSVSDAVLLTSRGGNAYDRTHMEAFLRPGLDRKSWFGRDLYPALGVVPTGPEEMSLYVTTHFTLPDYHLRRYSLRTDGFASVRAPYTGGEVVTKPVRFSGSKLVINYSSSAAGGVRVELLDAAGRPIPGYTEKESADIVGDEIARPVAWNGKEGLERLRGLAVKVRFVLRDADLYSFRFAP